MSSTNFSADPPDLNRISTDDIPMAARLVVLRRPAVRQDGRPLLVKTPTDAVMGSPLLFGASVQIGSIDNRSPSRANAGHGLLIHWCIVSPEIAPTMRLILSYRRPGEPPSTPALISHLDFSFSPIHVVRESRAQQVQEVSALTINRHISSFYVSMQFQSEGCRFTPPRAFQDIIDERPQSFLVQRSLQTISDLVKPESKTIRLNIFIPRPAARAELDQLLDKLPYAGNINVLRTFSEPHYESYRGSSGSVIAQYQSMQPRALVLRNHPGVPLPACLFPRDADEAVVRHTYGVNLLDGEEKRLLRSICGLTHEARFYSIGCNIVASIKLTLPMVANGRVEIVRRSAITDSTEVRISNLFQEHTRSIRAQGFVTADLYGTGADLFVMITDQTIDDFRGISSPLNLRSDLSAPCWDITLSDVPQDTVPEMRTQALKATFEPSSEILAAWPALLSYEGSTQTPSTFEDASATSKNDFHNAREWNLSQIRFFREAINAPGGMALCAGPGGSGKTSLMVAMIKFALDNGKKVLVTGMRHSSLDWILDVFVQTYPNSVKPTRAYNPRLEDPKDIEELGHVEEGVNHLQLELVLDTRRNFTSRRYRQVPYTVHEKVIANAYDVGRGPLRKAIVRRFEGDEDGGLDFVEVIDVRQSFRHWLEHHMLHHFRQSRHWPYRNLSEYKQAYAFLHEEVLQESQLLICTAIVAGKPEIGDSFATADGDEVVRFDDEAPTMLLADSLIPAALPKFGKKIKMWYMFSDEHQTGCLPAISKSECFNEFEADIGVSLFERLLAARHPVVRLNVQNRQHADIFCAVYDIYYNSLISTSLQHPLYEYRDLLGSICETGTQLEMTERQRRVRYLQVDGAYAKSPPSSSSKENPGFARVVVTKVLPRLREAFGHEVQRKVLLHTPYRAQYDRYRKEFVRLRNEGWQQSELPRLITTDASLSNEAYLVILDLVTANYRGFMRSSKRCCVAFTRAKEMQIVVGGNLSRDAVKNVGRLDDDNAWSSSKEHSLLHHYRWHVKNGCIARFSGQNYA